MTTYRTSLRMLDVPDHIRCDGCGDGPNAMRYAIALVVEGKRMDFCPRCVANLAAMLEAEEKEGRT